MRLALPTHRELPDWEVDDLPLHAALRARGARVERPIWDEPGTDWSGFDAVLIRTTWNYQEKRADFVAWAEAVERVTRLFNPARVVRWNTEKTYLFDLARRGVRVTPTVWLERGRRVDLAELCETHRITRGFLKPIVGAASRGTLRFAADHAGLASAQAHADRLLPQEGLMLQPYRDTVETEGELSLILVDGEPLHGVRKVPVPGDYRVQDDFDATDLPHVFAPDELESLRAIVAAAELELGLPPAGLLYARVDVLRAPDGGLYLNELEIVEPSLFFRHGPSSAGRLAEALLRRIGR
jgi:glutathione synthase/RimK-type ligase-like ATP-grasp enzyme